MGKKVDEYINKKKSPQKEICHKLRDHVNFGYTDGSKKMKHIEIKSIDEIDPRKITELIQSISPVSSIS